MTAFAEEDDTAPNDTQSASQPRLMVESYTLSKPVLKPNESATLEIKLKKPQPKEKYKQHCNLFKRRGKRNKHNRCKFRLY